MTRGVLTIDLGTSLCRQSNFAKVPPFYSPVAPMRAFTRRMHGIQDRPPPPAPDPVRSWSPASEERQNGPFWKFRLCALNPLEEIGQNASAFRRSLGMGPAPPPPA